MKTQLELKDVSKHYGALKVIDSLQFSLKPGEALGVIGPNGAGKSTMFNLIAGRVKPDSGQVYYLGEDITQFSAAKRCRLGIGRSHQIPHPFVGMTVFENLLVGAAFANTTKNKVIDDVCVGILDKTGLLHKANTRAGSLTLLERKRLEMARALATNPMLLLLDEIAGGLTDIECAELVETIRQIHASGVSIIWIEHIVHALLAVAERLIVINFGSKIAEGAPQKVMAMRKVKEIYMGIEAND